MDLARFEARLGSLVSERVGRQVELWVERATLNRGMIRVEGLVKGSLSRRWQPGVTLRSVMSDVQLQDGADSSHISVLQSDGQMFLTNVREADIRLRAGDLVVVGISAGSDLIVVVGPVQHPGAFEAAGTMTLAEAIQKAGGLTGHADSAKITLRHPDGSEQILSLEQDGAVRLKLGDWIAVGLTEVRLFVSISGKVPHQGLLEFRAGMTLTEAIRESGGDPLKVGDVVTVTRILDAGMRSTKYHLSQILSKLVPDPILSPADSIVLGGG
jgi:protein involved in polysaccharide export with SLBB domain